jgi:hypothetical protein
MNLVQLKRGAERRAGVVNGDEVRLLEVHDSVYSLAAEAFARGERLVSVAERFTGRETLTYADVYQGRSDWRLLPSFDHPSDVARCLVSGTGLTHKASAENRAAMHKQSSVQLTDSARMYQMGLEGGRPKRGEIGVQPEWFYKGDGSILRGHNEALLIPSYAGDGGEEPEIAGAYLISPEGEPVRVGLTIANEFSDHKMEKVNYLYLAPSKLRECAIGPELMIGDTEFENVQGTVSIQRGGRTLWQKEIWTGEKNMSHTVGNLEHHHFKYSAHRRPGDVHIHFFGADAFSFGEGVALEPDDVMEIWFDGFGKSLRNVLARDRSAPALMEVRVL